jgi:hypothetical protein
MKSHEGCMIPMRGNIMTGTSRHKESVIKDASQARDERYHHHRGRIGTLEY